MVTREQLEVLTKDALVQIAKTAGITLGDYDRKTKGDILDALLRPIAEGWVTATEIIEVEYQQRAAQVPAAPAKPKPAPAPVEAAQQLLGIVQSLAGAAVNEDRVREIVAEAVQSIKPAVEYRPIIVREQEQRKVEGYVHPIFEKVCKLVAAGINVALVGPAGCGKTKLAHQVADALGLEFGAISGSAGVSESQLLGWLLPVGDSGRFDYVASQFVNLYEKGNSLFLFDEMDAMDANLLVCTNMATANGGMSVPQRFTKPYVQRGKGAHLMAAMNTYGTGPDPLYVGRMQMDEATRSRWYRVEMDYDRELERQLGSAQVCEWVWSIREKAQAARLRRVIGTRMVEQAHAAVEAGLAFRDVKKDLLAGWTRDELAKVGANV